MPAKVLLLAGSVRSGSFNVSLAQAANKVLAEMAALRTSERQGRVIDRDESASMEVKKREGYF